jgi:hypothetical protein
VVRCAPLPPQTGWRPLSGWTVHRPCSIHWIGWKTPSGWTTTRGREFGYTRPPDPGGRPASPSNAMESTQARTEARGASVSPRRPPRLRGAHDRKPRPARFAPPSVGWPQPLAAWLPFISPELRASAVFPLDPGLGQGETASTPALGQGGRTDRSRGQRRSCGDPGQGGGEPRKGHTEVPAAALLGGADTLPSTSVPPAPRGGLPASPVIDHPSPGAGGGRHRAEWDRSTGWVGG